eukprot:TRINITY_DN6590_c0_g2_i2.p1 TRINITY_DN6590_c0_g2~~TRINITY_DN6590_c0_g2_i2.p1  ORF type:complete len:417 (-),score=44.86 TRINITY_DN6590_c0_g2_i2:597-1742(-)
MEQPPPSGAEKCGVATDDTFFFHTDRVLGANRLEQLDKTFADKGMPKNAAKDVTLQPSMTALGCDITASPPAAEPSTGKLAMLFSALLDVAIHQHASPVGLNRALGMEQWFCLLARPAFSIFDSVYEYVRREPDSSVARLPEGCVLEITVALFLMPLLGANLGRKFLPLLTACDASPAFGFGVCYMPCSAERSEYVCSLAERRGDYVRFYPKPGDSERVDRLGTAHSLPFHQSSFRVALSSKAKYRAHSGSLEAQALLLAVKWLLRTPRIFHPRLPVLIDAKAVLGAASKGRTSAPGIRGAIRKIGALLLASDCLLRLVYVPSEDNPADDPSRGKRHRFPNRKLLKKQRSKRSRIESRAERRLQELIRIERNLTARWGPHL